MKDLEELGRLKDLGLLTDEEFETARQEIFSQRPTANDPADDGDADPEEPEGSVEEGEVASPSELDIVSVDNETTTDSADNWWQASDGLWYPPEALDALKEQGWFQGDDGQWYPPTQTVIEEPVAASLDQSTEASSEQAPASVEPAAEASAITQDRTEGTPESDETDAPSRVRRVSADPLVPVPPAGRSSETSAAWRGSSQNATSARSFSDLPLAAIGGLFVAVAVIVMVFTLSNQNENGSQENSETSELENPTTTTTARPRPRATCEFTGGFNRIGSYTEGQAIFELIVGTTNPFDTSGKLVAYVDVFWHGAFIGEGNAWSADAVAPGDRAALEGSFFSSVSERPKDRSDIDALTCQVTRLAA